MPDAIHDVWACLCCADWECGRALIRESALPFEDVQHREDAERREQNEHWKEAVEGDPEDAASEPELVEEPEGAAAEPTGPDSALSERSQRRRAERVRSPAEGTSSSSGYELVGDQFVDIC